MAATFAGACGDDSPPAPAGSAGAVGSPGGGGDGGGAPPSVPPDEEPPTFAGIETAVVQSNGMVRATWQAGADDRDVPLAYRVFMAVDPAPIDYATSVATSPAGATEAFVGGVPVGQTVSFAVRAVDGGGNTDDNTAVASVVVPDAAAPRFRGVGSVDAVSGEALVVAWVPAKDEDAGVVAGYDVYVAPVGDDVTQATPIRVAAPATTTTIDGLDDGVEYQVLVRAVDTSGNADGNRAVLVVRTVDETAPSFTGVNSAVAGGTAVLLNWGAATDAVTGPAGIVYNVYQGTSASTIDYTMAVVTSPPGQSFALVNGLPASTELFFAVRAVDEAGNEDTNTVTTSATTGATADSAAPTFAGIADLRTLSSTSLSVEWATATDDLAPTDSIVYDVYVAPETSTLDFSADPYVSAEPGDLTLDLEGLQSGTGYRVAVRARDITGNRDTNTVELTARTKLDDTPPTFAGAGSATGLSATELEVTWPAATDETTQPSGIIYDVFLSATGTFNFAAPTRTVVGETSLVIDSLTRETGYEVVVRARDVDGNGETNELAVRGSTLADTTAPTLNGAPTLDAAEESMEVSWTAATDDSYLASQLTYDVFLATTAGGQNLAGTPAATSAVGGTTVTINGLNQDTQYYVVIVARDPDGNASAPSTERSALTSTDEDPPVFTASISLSGTTVQPFLPIGAPPHNNVTVSWSAKASDAITPDGDLVYELCYSTLSILCNEQNFTSIVQGTDVTSLEATDLTYGSRYYFAVRVSDLSGNSVTRSTVTDTTGPGTVSLATNDFSSPGANQLRVDWDAVSDSVWTNVRYRVRAENPTTGSFNTVTPTNHTSATVFTLTSTQFYNQTIEVRAVDGFGNFSSVNTNPIFGLGRRVGTVGFANSIQPMWNASCNIGCHFLPNETNWTRATTVNASTAASNGRPGHQASRIVPNNLAASEMFQRVIDRGDTYQMPSAGYDAVVEHNIREWILDGAPNN